MASNAVVIVMVNQISPVSNNIFGTVGLKTTKKKTILSEWEV